MLYLAFSFSSTVQSLYLSLSRQTLQAGLVTSAETRAGFETLERTIETTLGHTRSLVDLMLAEVSLLPKPIKEFRSILNKLQVVADLLVGLRQVREHGLRSIRNETVINVMDFRSQLVCRSDRGWTLKASLILNYHSHIFSIPTRSLQY